jgi:hypothetical protein
MWYTIIRREAYVLLSNVIVYIHMYSIIFCIYLSYDGLVEADIFGG